MRAEWNTLKMSEVFNLQMGKTPSRDDCSYWDGNTTWVSIGDIGASKYISESKEHITEKAILETGIKAVPNGNVIMSFKLSVGKVAITSTSLYTNEAIMAFIPKDGYELLTDYIYYYLKGYKWNGINRAAMGLTLNKASISQALFSYPPIAEQERIVGELDLLSGIIDKQKAQLRELDTLAQSIFYDMFGDPITNEKGWQYKVLGNILNTTSGGTPSKEHREYYDNGNIPWINSGDLHNMFVYESSKYITKDGLDNSSAKIFPIDTVLIAMYGATVGEVSILKLEGSTNQAVCGIFPNEKVNPVFLYFVLKFSKGFFIKKAAGGAQPNISQGIIKNYRLIVPPIELQNTFAEKIENIERQKELIKQSISDTETLFNSRMDYYFD